MLKEHKINKLNNFIKGFYINKNTCNDLIKLFNNNKHKATPGLIGDGIRPKIKKSNDLTFFPNSPEIEIQNYLKELEGCLEKYVTLFPHLNSHLDPWRIVEGFNIQKYNYSDAYFGWHTERSNKENDIVKRLLVFMTYLNNVKDKGETEWYYQKIKVKPEIGLTLIWPVDWMFIHRGIPSKKEKKFIITGWYSFI